MKRRRKIYESDDLKRENIVGEEEKQNQQEAMENCEEPKRRVKRSKRVRKQVKDEDDENATPSATPAGDNGTEPAEQQVVATPTQEEKKDDLKPTIEYVLQALRDREEELKQKSEQQFAAQRQIYDQDLDTFMKNIEKYIESN